MGSSSDVTCSRAQLFHAHVPAGVRSRLAVLCWRTSHDAVFVAGVTK